MVYVTCSFFLLGSIIQGICIFYSGNYIETRHFVISWRHYTVLAIPSVRFILVLKWRSRRFISINVARTYQSIRMCQFLLWMISVGFDWWFWGIWLIVGVWGNLQSFKLVYLEKIFNFEVVHRNVLHIELCMTVYHASGLDLLNSSKDLLNSFKKVSFSSKINT